MAKVLFFVVAMGLLLPAASRADDERSEAYCDSHCKCDDGCKNSGFGDRRVTGPVLAADANGVVRLRNTAKHPVQPGVAGRLGYQLFVGDTATLTPEVMFEWDHFEKDQNAIRVLGGLRYAAGSVVRPSVFAHAGWGRLNFGDSASQHAFAVDGGAALDVFLMNTLAIGAQGAYNLINTDVPVDFLTFGAHLALTF